MTFSRALVGLVMCVACSSGRPDSAATPAVKSTEPVGEGRAKLWLSSTVAAGNSVVSVHFKRGTNQPPRVADIRLAYADSLEFVGSQPGNSVTDSGKDLIGQTPQTGMVRLVVLSRDSKELSDGVVASIEFRRKGQGAKVDFMMDKPVFAPAEAMQGLLIGDPAEL